MAAQADPRAETRDLLGRLVRANAAWISAAAAVIGVVLLVIERVGTTKNWTWVGYVPIGPIGAGLISGAIAVFVFEILLREDSLRRTSLVVSEAVSQTESAVRGAVVSELAFGDASLSGVVSTEQLDRLIVRSLEARYGNERLAMEGYASMRMQLLDVDERWEDMKVSGNVSPITQLEEWFPLDVDRDEFLVFHLSWRYRCVLQRETFLFIGAADQEAYSRLIKSKVADHVYRYAPTLPESLRHVGLGMAVEELSVNRQGVQLLRDDTRDEFTGSADFLHDLVGKEVEVFYTMRTITRRDSHVITFEVPRPCFGVDYVLNFDTAIIQSVRVLDFFSSEDQVDVRITPSPTDPRTVTLSASGWVFPKSGFGVVWALRPT